VRVWTTADRKLLHLLSGRFASVNSLAFSADGSILAVGRSGGLEFWRTAFTAFGHFFLA
jgi:hypothetical protein